MDKNTKIKAENVIDGFFMKGRCFDCGKIGEINKMNGMCKKCMNIVKKDINEGEKDGKRL